MAHSQSVSPSSGAPKPIFSGDLGVLDAADSFLSNFGDEYAAATRSAAAYATHALQSAAEHNEHWAEYADQMYVQYSPKEQGFLYMLRGTDEELQHMRELEHGSPQLEPAPIVRSTAVRNTDAISRQLTLRMNL